MISPPFRVYKRFPSFKPNSIALPSCIDTVQIVCMCVCMCSNYRVFPTWRWNTLHQSTCTCSTLTLISIQRNLLTCIHTYITYTHSSYMTLIGVHELCSRAQPNYCHVNNLFACDPLSSSGYLMITYTHPVASNLLIIAIGD